MSLNRRQFVAGAGAAVGMAGLGTTALANEVVSIEIAEVKSTEETVVLENTGDEAVDLEGYQLDWEHKNDVDQVDTIDDSLTLEPGEQVSIWTGFQSTQIDDVQADHQIADYDNGRINDDDPDVIALLSPDGEVVATSDGYSAGGDDSSDDSDSDSDTDADTDEGDDTDGEATEDSDEGDANEETAESVEEEADTGTKVEEDDGPEEEEAAVDAEAEEEGC